MILLHLDAVLYDTVDIFIVIPESHFAADPLRFKCLGKEVLEIAQDREIAVNIIF